MTELKSLEGSAWLAEPVFLQRAIERIARIPACPTARDIVAYRRERLEEAKQAAGRAVRGVRGTVGVIGVHGPIEQRMSSELIKLGGTSTEEVSIALDALLAAKEVGAIVLHVDSPGGGVYGIEELSDKIYAARAQKPLYAIADSMACSAAYWIASAAETLAVTPGGDVGSVGVFCVHLDQSVAMEMEGVRPTVVTAGKYKAEFLPLRPLGTESVTYLQETVDYIYDKFLAALKRNRGVSLDHVRREFGQGRAVNAGRARDAKMADKVMSFEQLMAKLSGSPASAPKAASTEVLRLRHQRQRQKDAWPETA